MSNEDTGGSSGSRPWIILAVALLFIAVVAVLFVVILKQRQQLQKVMAHPVVVKVVTPNPTIQELTRTNDATFALHVLDAETGMPVKSVLVLVQSFIRSPWSIRTVGKKATDEQGQISLPIPTSQGVGLRICAAAEGYDSTLLMWEPGSDIPASYEIKLAKGLTISAYVVDESSRPVTNASILAAKGFPVYKSRIPGALEQTGFGDEFLQKRPNQEGKWTCAFLPKDLKAFMILVTRPGQPETLFQVSDTATSLGIHQIRLSDLLSGTAKLTVSSKP